ncbi:MAG: hypothetical protein JNL92_25010 [Opitutaceae bacterium]|nr:hypothetical protein [Opitutaceae bacterium]
MNNDEAKFILAAYRPDGRDAHDARFAEAIAQAGRDPELRAWWERQRAFDAQVAAKLAAVMPPPGLRESILAGGRLSEPRRPGWKRPVWLAAAAAVVLLALLAVTLRPALRAPSLQDFAAFALQDMVDDYAAHTGFPPGLDGVQGRLATATLPLSQGLTLSLDELRRHRCRTVTIAGREVFELCFQRDGTWFHLYAAARSDFSTGSADPKSLLVSRGNLSATAWADSATAYALVARGGAATLQRLF